MTMRDINRRFTYLLVIFSPLLTTDEAGQHKNED